VGKVANQKGGVGKTQKEGKTEERSKKVSFKMRPSLHRRLQIAAVMHEREMSEILDGALVKALDKLGTKPSE